jgi:GNAT superfamily N-acetyltransferase
MLPAMSRDEILQEIVERPREAYTRLPDMQVIVRPGWRQLITPSVKRGGFNDVSLAQLREDEADAVIAATIAEYKRIGCKFVWRVGPDSTPRDLPERLARTGLTYGLGLGMARSTEMDAAHVEVERIDESTVDVFTETIAAGWGQNPEEVRDANRRAVASTTHQLWLARCGGEPAATAGSVLFEKSIYLIGGVTLEKFRGRGLYRALVAARLAFARSRGVMLATSIARAETSAPILERLGFETLCKFDNYSST